MTQQNRKTVVGGGCIFIDQSSILCMHRGIVNDSLEDEIPNLVQKSVLSADDVDDLNSTFKHESNISGSSPLEVGGSSKTADRFKPLQFTQSIFIALFPPSHIQRGDIRQLDELTVFQTEQVSLNNEKEYFTAVITRLAKSNLGFDLTPLFLLLDYDGVDFYLVVYVNARSWNINVVDRVPNTVAAHKEVMLTSEGNELSLISQFLSSDSIIGNRNVSVFDTRDLYTVLPDYEQRIYDKLLVLLNRNVGKSMALSVEMNGLRFLNLKDALVVGPGWDTMVVSSRRSDIYDDSKIDVSNALDDGNAKQVEDGKDEEGKRKLKSGDKIVNKSKFKSKVRVASGALKGDIIDASMQLDGLCDYIRSNRFPLTRRLARKQLIKSGTAAVVMPLGHGKSDLALAHHEFVNVDALYDDTSELKILRISALRTGDWTAYNAKLVDVVSAKLKVIIMSGRILLVQHPSIAELLGFSVIGIYALRNKRILRKHLKISYTDQNFELAEMNLRSVRKEPGLMTFNDLSSLHDAVISNL